MHLKRKIWKILRHPISLLLILLGISAGCIYVYWRYHTVVTSRVKRWWAQLTGSKEGTIEPVDDGTENGDTEEPENSNNAANQEAWDKMVKSGWISHITWRLEEDNGGLDIEDPGLGMTGSEYLDWIKAHAVEYAEENPHVFIPYPWYGPP
jgi:hypothetical protein